MFGLQNLFRIVKGRCWVMHRTIAMILLICAAPEAFGESQKAGTLSATALHAVGANIPGATVTLHFDPNSWTKLLRVQPNFKRRGKRE